MRGDHTRLAKWPITEDLYGWTPDVRDLEYQDPGGGPHVAVPEVSAAPGPLLADRTTHPVTLRLESGEVRKARLRELPLTSLVHLLQDGLEALASDVVADRRLNLGLGRDDDLLGGLFELG